MNREQLGEWLSAYLDGEVSAGQRDEIERILKEDADARRILDELRTAVAAVSSLPRHVAPASIAEEIQSVVERSELISEADAPRSRGHGRRLFLPALVSMAAVIGLSVGGFWMSMDQDSIFENVNAPLASPTAALRSAGRSEERTALGSRDGDTDSGAVGERIALAATMDQKILAGLPVSAARRHSFGNEPVRLKIRVSDAREGEAVVASAIAQLRGKASVDLDRLASTTPDEPLPAQGFHLRGERGVNFEGEDERQVLVRASRRELGALVNNLSGDARQRRNISLAAGPVSIRGSTQVRSVFSELEGAAVSGDEARRSDGALAMTSATGRVGEDDRVQRAVSFLDELVRPPVQQDLARLDEKRAADRDLPNVSDFRRLTRENEGIESADAAAAAEATAPEVGTRIASRTPADSEELTIGKGEIGKGAVEQKMGDRGRTMRSPGADQSPGKITKRGRRAIPSTRAKATVAENTAEPMIEAPTDSYITLVIEVSLDKPKSGLRVGPSGERPRDRTRSRPPSK